jgi:hypothetical protein
LEQATADQLIAAADELAAVRKRFVKLLLNDAAKEFEGPIRTGFGQDGTPEDVVADFTAVRGEADTNSFIRQMNDENAALDGRIARFKEALAKM